MHAADGAAVYAAGRYLAGQPGRNFQPSLSWTKPANKTRTMQKACTGLHQICGRIYGKTICGADCTQCGLQDTCAGCVSTDGRPFGGDFAPWRRAAGGYGLRAVRSCETQLPADCRGADDRGIPRAWYRGAGRARTRFMRSKGRSSIWNIRFRAGRR